MDKLILDEVQAQILLRLLSAKCLCCVNPQEHRELTPLVKQLEQLLGGSND